MTFNLTDSSYGPFNETNNEINYIHKQLSYPYSPSPSSNQKIFNDSIPICQEALIKTGYNHKLTYQKHDLKKDTQHKRQIIWFNPPYSLIQNYCFQESGWLLFSCSSPYYWTNRFPVKTFHENFNVTSNTAEDTMVL